MSVTNDENVTSSIVMGRLSKAFTVEFGPNFSDDGIQPAYHIIRRPDIERLAW
jgi:hypothetical protein